VIAPGAATGTGQCEQQEKQRASQALCHGPKGSQQGPQV
jgi:hypothetical protein